MGVVYEAEHPVIGRKEEIERDVLREELRPAEHLHFPDVFRV